MDLGIYLLINFNYFSNQIFIFIIILVVNVSVDDVEHDVVVKKAEDFLNLVDAFEDFLVDFFDVVNLKDTVVLVTDKSEE